AQHDGAGDAVVDAALVAVPDERRYGEAEQQRADHDREEVGPVRPYRGDAHAEQAHAERGPDGADEQDVLYGEGGEADPGGARRVGAEQPAGDRPDADQPVDEERAGPAPEPGDRALAVLGQAQPLPRVSKVGARGPDTADPRLCPPRLPRLTAHAPTVSAAGAGSSPGAPGARPMCPAGSARSGSPRPAAG